MNYLFPQASALADGFLSDFLRKHLPHGLPHRGGVLARHAFLRTPVSLPLALHSPQLRQAGIGGRLPASRIGR